MVFQNVRQRMKKRSAMFWKTMGNVFPFIGSKHILHSFGNIQG